MSARVVSPYQQLIHDLAFMMIHDQIDDLTRQGLSVDPQDVYHMIMDSAHENLVEDFQEELSCMLNEMYAGKDI
jgi:hypothetical protein